MTGGNIKVRGRIRLFPCGGVFCPAGILKKKGMFSRLEGRIPLKNMDGRRTAESMIVKSSSIYSMGGHAGLCLRRVSPGGNVPPRHSPGFSHIL